MKPLELSEADLRTLGHALLQPAPPPNARLVALLKQAPAFFGGFRKLTTEEVEAERRRAYNYEA